MTEAVIPLQAVESANIQGLGYDAPSQTLAVQFKAGSMYHYSNVPPELFEQFVKADSKGKFLREFVIQKFPYKKVS